MQVRRTCTEIRKSTTLREGGPGDLRREDIRTVDLCNLRQLITTTALLRTGYHANLPARAWRRMGKRSTTIRIYPPSPACSSRVAAI